MDEIKKNSETTSLLPEKSGNQCPVKLKAKNQSLFDKIKSKYFKNTQIVRTAFLILIVLIALFLLIYSSYLIAIQFLLNAAYKYNMKLVYNNQMFFEIDAINYEFNLTCSVKNPSIDCIMMNIDRFKEKGITDIILKNVFDENYDLLATFGTLEAFKKMLRSFQSNRIGVYMDIPKIQRNYIQRRDNLELAEDDSNQYYSVNKTCIDSYKTDVMKVVNEYSKLKVDGFIINDLPCCIIYPESYLDKCSFDLIFKLRKIARKFGKPSALIYRSKPLYDDKLWRDIKKLNYTYFDAIISYIMVTEDGGVKFTSKWLIDIFPQNIWSLRVEKSNISNLTNLYNTIWAFYTGATLYQPSKTSDESNQNDDIYQRFSDDLDNVEIIANLKKSLKNISCVSNASAYVPDYSDNNLFISVLPLNHVKFRYCVLVVNFGNTSTDINTRLYFKNYPSMVATGVENFKISKDGLISSVPSHQKSTFTVSPMSATVLQINRDVQ